MENEYLEKKIRASSIKNIDFIVEVDKETADLVADDTRMKLLKMRVPEYKSNSVDECKDIFFKARNVSPVNILDKVSRRIFSLDGIKISSVTTIVYGSTSPNQTIKYRVSIKVHTFVNSLRRFIYEGNGRSYEIFRCLMSTSSFLRHLLELSMLSECDNSKKVTVYEHIRYMYNNTLSDNLKEVIPENVTIPEALMHIDADSLMKILLNTVTNIFTTSGLIIENIYILDALLSINVYPLAKRKTETFYEVIPAFDMMNIMETLEKKSFESILQRDTIRIKKNICKIEPSYKNEKHLITLENTNKKSSKFICSSHNIDCVRLWAYNAFSYNISKNSMTSSDLGDDVKISTLVENPDNFSTYFDQQYEPHEYGNVTINVYLNIIKNYKSSYTFKSRKKMYTDFNLKSATNKSVNTPYALISNSISRYKYILDSVNNNLSKHNVSLNNLISNFMYGLFLQKLDMLMSEERAASLYTISYFSNMLKFINEDVENGDYHEVQVYLDNLVAEFPDIEFSKEDLGVRTIVDLIKMVKKNILEKVGRDEYIRQSINIICNILTNRQSGVLAIPGDTSTMKVIRKTVLSLVFNIKCSELTSTQDRIIMEAFNNQALHSVISSYAYGISLATLRKYDICNPINSARLLSDMINLCIFLDSGSKNFYINSK